MSATVLKAGAATARAGSLIYRDIHAPRDLLPDLAAALASHDRELILLTSNDDQYDLAVNLIANLATFGLHNHVLLTDNAVLSAHASRQGAVAAVWSTMLDGYTERPAVGPDCPAGCHDSDPRTSGRTHTPLRCRRTLPAAASAGAESCPPSPAAFYRADAVRRLWLMRYHYAARLVGLRYRVLVLDSDSIVLTNPYPLLRALAHEVRPLGLAVGVEDVGAWPDMSINGGTWYLSARPGGPVQDLFASVMEHAGRVLDAYPARRVLDTSPKVRRGKAADFLLFDQTLVNVALLSRCLGRPVNLTSSESIQMATGALERQRVQWKRACCYAAPSELGHPPWRAGDEAQLKGTGLLLLCGGGGSGGGGVGGSGGGSGVRGMPVHLQGFIPRHVSALLGGGGASAACDPSSVPYGTAYELRYHLLRNHSPEESRSYLPEIASREIASREISSLSELASRPPTQRPSVPVRAPLAGVCGERCVPRDVCARLCARRAGAVTVAATRVCARDRSCAKWSRFSDEGQEAVLKSPPWLFASESDRGGKSGRTHATFWGARPPPAAIIHFVCSSWPGSDGRRAAMRLWGRWHAADVYAEAPERGRALAEFRQRGFVSFDAPVDAARPAALMPYLRLLTLVAHATGRTPTLPVVRCDAEGQAWVEELIDARTGWPTSQSDVKGKGSKGKGGGGGGVGGSGGVGRVGGVGGMDDRSGRGRPCGWAFHHIAERSSTVELEEPLCVQRPLEGCFLAFATPDELAPHVPVGFWRRFAARGRTSASAQPGAETLLSATTAVVDARLHATVEADAHESRRVSSSVVKGPPAVEADAPPLLSLFDGANGRNLTLDELSRRTRPYVLPTTTRPYVLPTTTRPYVLPTTIPMSAGAAAARVPLLLIGTPSAALLAQQPLLDKERVGEALRTINRGSLVPTNGPARWGSTWMQCMRMVLNNKCAAVC